MSRDAYQIIGIDPGKHNLLQAVDSERRTSREGSVRYTLRERRKDMRTRQYAKEAQDNKPIEVLEGEAELTNHNSRSATLETFVAYCTCRRTFLKASLAFYSSLDHRRRRRKSKIKQQQSERRFFDRLHGLQKDASRPLLLAYGSWGLTTSKKFKGLPPCVGARLARRLATEFIVVPTPEQYTSKTCPKWFGPCGPHPTLRHLLDHRRRSTTAGIEVTRASREIRGLRVCQNESCKLHLSRDHTGACNIATNLERLMRDEAPIRKLTVEDKQLCELQCQLCS